MSFSNLRLPSLYGDLLYSSLGAPSSAPYVSCTDSGRHFSRLTYKFYGAWWPRVASWRSLSGFVVQRNSCSTSLTSLFNDWTRFSRKKSCLFWVDRNPTLASASYPLYYEGKMMKTPFPQNYVYVLRTTTTRHMVSCIDFNFHFLANFQT